MSLRIADLPSPVQLAFDISPLSEPRFTGVSNVVAKLLEHFRSACPERLHPFHRGLLVPDAVVARVLATKNGTELN